MDKMNSDWRIIRYGAGDAELWNGFAKRSRNATFMLQRGYVDYHSARFVDCSWLAFKGNSLRAMLPANIDADGVLHSHQGLTYGGWILPQAHLDGADLLHLFEAAADRWREEGITALDYKPIPFIYAARPSQEDIYALFRLGARASECNLSAAINLRAPGGLNQLQRRHLKKCAGLDLRIVRLDESGEFMEMLSECLRERHDTAPVHTRAELDLLRERFPENIKLYGAICDGGLHAGVCVYDTGRVAHAQYIATTPLGRELNLLTPLFNFLISGEFPEAEYFDFGISNEDHGLYLNEGLLRQKYSYGATGVICQRYLLEL